MFRRSRFSVRPNVSTLGRTASAASQETAAASETLKEAGENTSAAAPVTSKTDVTPLSSGDGNEQNGEGASSSAAVQRRKRFSVKPKVAPGRLPALSRTPKSPVKVASAARVESHDSGLDQPSTSSQTGATAAPQGLQSPRRRRHSEDGNQLKMPPKATPSETSGPPAVSTAVESPDQSHLASDSSKKPGDTSGSQGKEAPLRPPEKVPPSLPDKEATEISEKAKTLVSSKNVSSLKPSAPSLTRLLNSPSDLQRLVKAQKLRELLKQERSKEKRLKRAKCRPKEFTLDPAKMTMRDLIYYLPTSNPMSSSLEEAQENETDVPPSPGREESPEQAQEPKILPNKAVSREEEEEAAVADVEEEEEEAAAEEEEALMVPQVKVAEDGSLIIDEESLTVEVQRAKGPNLAEGRDPIFERGSTTTYSSFRKGTYTRPWSAEETDMFFLAISMVGTDFSMICQLFPHRARSEIKNKFKREERENSWRIDKAFRERRKLDIEYFSKLLEKVLEVQKDRKKLKSLAEKNTTKRSRTKAKGKKSAKKLSDIEEEEDENKVLELEEGGEKENEDQSNEGGVPASEPKKKRKRNAKPAALNEEPTDKENKTDEVGIPEDSEAALPEDQTNDMSEKTENVNPAKDTTIKPAKLCRSRAPKPLVPLGLKRGKKPLPAVKAKETSPEKGGESARDGDSNKQENNDESQMSQSNKKKSDDVSSEEDDTPVKPQKPTRYGRVPKPTQPLNYPSKDEPCSSASETAPASPSTSKSKPKSSLKRGKASKQQPAEKSKKAKLITLRSSKSEFSDEDNENQDEEGEGTACSSSKDSDAPLFVPDSLHATNPEITEVDESMVELEILASMPDVLGISQDALCPDSSCHQAQHETGTAEPCEHQLDLLVDVIDFLSSEHAEVSHDESYNEAAQALLTIGNMPHVSQSAQSETSLQDYTTGATWAGGNEPSQTEVTVPPFVSADFSQELTETSANASTVELQGSGAGSCDPSHIKTSDQTFVDLQTVCMDPTPPVQPDPESSNINVPPTKIGRFSKVKPKPNLGRTPRAAQPVSHAGISTGKKVEESHLAAPDLPQVNDTPSAAEETAPKISQSAALLKDHVLPAEVKVTEEPSDNKKLEVKSGAPTSDQSSCSFSESQLEPSRNQSTADTKSTPESTDETLISHAGTAETGCNKPATSDSATTEADQELCTDLAPVQESGDKPSCVPSAGDLTSSQKGEGEVAAHSRSRRSRLPKVKPKPNLPQSSRAAKSKPQATEDTVDQDSAPTQKKQTIPKVEPQPTCPPSPTSILAEEPPANEEIKTHAGVVDQAILDASSSDQSVTENQNISKVQREPNREQVTRETGSISAFTEENLATHGETPESSCRNVALTDVAVTEPPDGQGSTVDSEEKGDPAETTAPVEEFMVSQREGKATTTSQLRRSRLQKLQPNLPQTSRAARPKPQTAEKSEEKDSNPSPNPEFIKNIIADVEPQLTCTPSIVNRSESTDPTSIKSEEKKTCAGLVNQMDTVANTSGQSTTETQQVSEVQIEPSGKQAAREPPSTSEFTDENLIVGSGAAESQVHQALNLDPPPVQQHSDHPEVLATPVEESPVTKPDVEGSSTAQLRRSRSQKIKPKPNIPQTSRGARFKLPTTEASVEKDPNTSSNPKFTKKMIEEVEPQPPCTPLSEEQSESTDPAAVSKPSGALSSTASPTEEKKTDSRFRFKQMDMDTATSGQSSSENFAKVQLEPSREETTRVRGSGTEITDEALMPHAGTTESSCDDVVLTDKPDSERQDDQELKVDPAAEEGRKVPAACITPAEDMQVCQDEDKITSASHFRKSQLQKPKPNLTRALKGARFKPQTTKESVEKDTSPIQNPDFDKTAVAELKSQDTLLPEKQSESTNVALISEEDLTALRSDPSSSGTQSFSGVQPEPDREQAETQKTSVFKDENLTSHAQTTHLVSLNNVASGDSARTESQSGQSSNVGSAPVQDQSGHLSAFDTSAGKSSDSREETEVASHCQPRRSRFQRPKPNLQQASRTAGFKPQAKNEPAEKDLSASPKPEFSKRAIAEAEPQKEETLLPTKHSGSTAVGLVSKEDLVELRSDPVASEDQSISGVQPEPSMEQVTDENLASGTGTAESSLNNVMSADMAAIESQGGQTPNVDSASVQEQSDQPSTVGTVGKEEVQVAPACQTRRSRFPKPKPNLPQTSRTARLKPQTTKETVSPSPKSELTKNITAEVQPQLPSTALPQKRSENTPGRLSQVVDKSQSSTSRTEPSDNTLAEVEARSTQEKSRQNESTGGHSVSETSLESASAHKCTEEPSSAQEQLRTNTEKVSSSEAAEQNEPHKRRRFSKVGPKPNLASLSKPQSGDSSKSADDQRMDTCPPVTSERAGDGGGNLTVEVQSTGHKVSNNDQVATDSTSLGDCKVDANIKLTTDPAAVPDAQRSTQVSTESKVCSEGESSVQRPPELADSSKAPRKTPQPCRGRLSKPKPNLRCSSRPPQPQQADDTAPAEADSSSCSQDVEASVDHKPEAELAAETQESTEDVIDGLSNKNSNNAQSSLDPAPQAISAQNPSTSSTEGIQGFPLLFDMLAEQLPSDPDEPFFILSLTEIPVSSAGEVVSAVVEPSPYLPVTDPPTQQPSVSETSLVAVGDGSTSTASSSVSTTETCGMVDLTEPAVASSHLCLQGNAQESTTVQPSKFPETVDADKSETSPSKLKLAGSGRRANVQVRPRSARKKQTTPAVSEMEPAAAQASTSRDSNPPGPSKDAVETAKEALSRRSERDGGSGLQTAPAVGSRRKRKAREFPSFASETNNPPESNRPPGKAASKRAKVKPPAAEAEPSCSGPVASTSRDAEPPAWCFTQPTTSAAQSEEACDQTPGWSALTSSTPQCSAEASTSQEGDVADSSSIEDEPTSVSQYFFSDIFTEVDEG